MYYDLPSGDPALSDLCNLACSNPDLDICHVQHIPSSGDISKVFPMNWRFFPTLDPQVKGLIENLSEPLLLSQVDSFLSRDLDSRLNSREAVAVNEFLGTPHSFHFLRDHPSHGVEVLGSGWGARLGPHNSIVRKLFRESFMKASHDYVFWAERKSWGPDQNFLNRYIWPWARLSSLSHDSYSCNKFPNTRPFPTRRESGPNNFVAAVVEVGVSLQEPCPVECRPSNHQDWVTC